MLWWIYLSVFDFYSDFFSPSHACKWYFFGSKNLFILKLLLLLGLIFDALSPINTSFLMSYRLLITISAKLCIPKKVWLWPLFFFFLILKFHYCRSIWDRFFHKPVSSFSVQESGHSCYFSSIFAAMASKCLVMFSESCTSCPQWYWICFCIVSRDKVLNWQCHMLNG